MRLLRIKQFRFLTMLAASYLLFNLTFCPIYGGESEVLSPARILNQYCSGCHNDRDAEAEFSVGSPQNFLAFSSEAGPLIDKRSPDASRLLQLLTGTASPKMPPVEEPQPSSAEVDVIRGWIRRIVLENGTQSDSSWNDSRAEPPTLQIAPAPLESQFVSAAASLGDGRLSLGRYSKLDFVSEESKVLLGSMPVGESRLSALRLSPSGRWLAIGSGKPGISGLAFIVDVTTLDVLQTHQGHLDSVYALALSPDEKFLASGSYDRRIIVWNLEDQVELLSLNGHNGAITDLDFHPNGELLASTSTDGTVKLWHVPTGNRLDTLGQPEGELRSVRFSLDGNYLFATGADRQIRCWRITSTKSVSINPMIESRFAHEKEIVCLAVADVETLVSSSIDGTTKAWSIPDLLPLGTLVEDVGMPVSICIGKNSDIHVVDIKGGIKSVSAKWRAEPIKRRATWWSLAQQKDRKVLDLAITAAESDSTAPDEYYPDLALETLVESEPNDSVESAFSIRLPCKVKGKISKSSTNGECSDEDFFRFSATKGERWIFEIEAARHQSGLDSYLAILDSQGGPVLSTRLQAVRESYFTFRGKDSTTSDDFRLHKWEDMELDEYLYAGSEVVRLWLYPRGPDSGFKVYPGRGARHNYFGTTPVSHALGDPVYIVRPLEINEDPLPNGLPVFPVYFENDDDPNREFGKDSVVHFQAPWDGQYILRLRDTRGFSGDGFDYHLVSRRPRPDYLLNVSTNQLTVPRGSGREWSVSVKRIDGMDQAISVSLSGLPTGIEATNPVIIEQGQTTALGTLFVSRDAELTNQPIHLELTARVVLPARDLANSTQSQSVNDAELAGLTKQLEAIQLNIVEKNEPTIYVAHSDNENVELTELTIQPGQTISARIAVQRNGKQGHISFGKDDAGRNLPHGAFVDNVGLNGLLITEDSSSREIFITAAPKLQPGIRQFHFRAETEGNPTSRPIRLNITR